MARLELHDPVLEELDIEGVVDFAEVVATDAARLWIEGSLDERQRLQAVLSPRACGLRTARPPRPGPPIRAAGGGVRAGRP